jgi:hypothetical protein
MDLAGLEEDPNFWNYGPDDDEDCPKKNDDKQPHQGTDIISKLERTRVNLIVRISDLSAHFSPESLEGQQPYWRFSAYEATKWKFRVSL